jgi:hypothetical protein
LAAISTTNVGISAAAAPPATAWTMIIIVVFGLRAMIVNAPPNRTTVA